MKRQFRNDVSSDTKQKQSIAHRGKTHTPETKYKISVAMKAYWDSLPYKNLKEEE